MDVYELEDKNGLLRGMVQFVGKAVSRDWNRLELCSMRWKDGVLAACDGKRMHWVAAAWVCERLRGVEDGQYCACLDRPGRVALFSAPWRLENGQKPKSSPLDHIFPHAGALEKMEHAEFEAGPLSYAEICVASGHVVHPEHFSDAIDTAVGFRAWWKKVDGAPAIRPIHLQMMLHFEWTRHAVIMSNCNGYGG